MKVVYKPGNASEEVNCFDFREFEHGVVLRNEEGCIVGYVPHEILGHIVPHPRGGGPLRERRGRERAGE